MFAKVFASLWNGSMRGQANTQLVFVYMLANADADGVFDQVPEAICEATGLAADAVRDALAELGAPDVRSRSPEAAGARITLLDDHRDWGWQIVNYQRYRTLRDLDDKREKDRERQRRHRASRAVTPCHTTSRDVAQAEVEAEADKPTPTPPARSARSEKVFSLKEPDRDPPPGVEPKTWADWFRFRWEIKKPLTVVSAAACVRKLVKFYEAGHDPDEIIENSIANRWQGLFIPKEELNGSQAKR